MTDEQIVKALEICNSLSQRCGDGCPYYTVIYKNGKRCSEMMIDDTLALIKRQQAEIERLQKESADKESAYIDEFCCRKEWQCKCRDLLQEKIEAKAEAVREFAEKLKNIYTYDKRYSKPIIPHTRLDFLFCKIDDLVREMTEKEGGKG